MLILTYILLLEGDESDYIILLIIYTSKVISPKVFLYNMK